MPSALRLLAALPALLAACHPANPPATQAATVAPADTVAAVVVLAPAAAPTAPATPPLDTLHLPGGQVAELRLATAAAFARLDSTNTVPDYDTLEQPLPTRVRRVGRSLLLQPTTGPLARVVSDRPARAPVEETDKDTCNYRYWGSLPMAHQWVVYGQAWTYYQTLLIDQRTGRQLVVNGRPAASPKGSYVLVCSADMAGVTLNGLTLVDTAPGGPRLLWQRQMRGFSPRQARWAAPGRWLLQAPYREDLNDGPPHHYKYLELTLPPAAGQPR